MNARALTNPEELIGALRNPRRVSVGVILRGLVAVGPAIRRLLLVLVVLAAVPSTGRAQTPDRDLSQLSIEDLLNIEITSAARKEQRTLDVASAVFVITHDDIRRSGMTTVPDLLRLAPGVDVAQINSNKWAVSVRGFNALYANKLLVLVDGRNIYNQTFSGVPWDTEDLMLDDIDRIEVIRGPGAAIWGANAVNGVINIVTRAAAETQGTLVRVEGGRAGALGAVRYGGTFGAASYRVYSQWTRRDQSLIAPDARANDASHSVTTGFRTDWTATPGAFIVEGDFTAGQARALWPNFDPQTAARDPIAHQPSDTRGGHLLGRWTQTRASGAAFQIQSSVDVTDRQEPVGRYTRQAMEVDTQYHGAFGIRHDVVAGVGYRFMRERFAGRTGISLTPADNASSLLSTFVQDEIALFAHRLALTVGTHLQYDSDSGAGVQPTARLMWKVRSHQRVWAATSRALRTPARSERGIRLDRPPIPTASGLPMVVTQLGNPAAHTETFVDAKAGYRWEIGTAASIDVTGFVGYYEYLATRQLEAPILQLEPAPHLLLISRFANQLQATTRGLEVAAHWSPSPTWRLDGSYTGFKVTPRLATGSTDPTAATTDGNTPRTQWQLRSAWAPVPRATLNLAIFRVGRLEQLRVGAYTRADITAEWRITRRLSAMAIGQNLFDAAHPEFATAESFLLSTQVPRSVSLRLRWTSL